MNKKNYSGQVTMEFTFCMIIAILLLYGIIKAFMWVGLDLVDRRQTHDETLTLRRTHPDFLEEDFHGTREMDLIFKWE